MGKKLLIDGSKRNLLIFSDFLKEKEPKIYKILKENRKIDEITAEKYGVTEKIKQNLPAWSNFSSEEWIPDKNNPILTTDVSGNKHCKLCNQPIKFQYKVKNKRNKMEILIGGNCVNNFKQLDSMIKIIKTEKEYIRYNKLLKYNSDIYDILMTDSKLLQKTEIILPKGYYDSFDKRQKQVKRLLMNYIRRGKSPKKKEIDKLLSLYRYERSNLKHFVKQNNQNTDYVTRKTANEIENNQNDDYKEIITEVMENNGKLSAVISMKIKVVGRLNRIKPLISNQLPKEITLEQTSFGMFILSIQKFNDNYIFKVDSPFLLELFYRKKLRKFDDVFLENLRKFDIFGVRTKEKLLILSESFVTSDNLFRLKEIDYRKIVYRYDGDLTVTEFNEVLNKVASVLEKYTIFEKKWDTNLYIYRNTTLEEKGKELLFSQLDRTKQKIIDSYDKKLEIKELYDWILQAI